MYQKLKHIHNQAIIYINAYNTNMAAPIQETKFMFKIIAEKYDTSKERRELYDFTRNLIQARRVSPYIDTRLIQVLIDRHDEVVTILHRNFKISAPKAKKYLDTIIALSGFVPPPPADVPINPPIVNDPPQDMVIEQPPAPAPVINSLSPNIIESAIQDDGESITINLNKLQELTKRRIIIQMT